MHRASRRGAEGRSRPETGMGRLFAWGRPTRVASIAIKPARVSPPTARAVMARAAFRSVLGASLRRKLSAHLRIHWHGRLTARRHRKNVIVVEPVQDPDVPPAHAANERTTGPEPGLVVTNAWELVRVRQGGDRREHCAETRRPRRQAQCDHAPTKRGAQLCDSSGHGDSPVAAQPSSCSTVSSM